MFISFDSEAVSESEMNVHLPLVHSNTGSLIPLRDFFEREVAIEEPISMDACQDLSQVSTSNEERARLQELGSNEKEYEKNEKFAWREVG